MALIKSMTRDLGITQRVSVDEVRYNILNNTIYSENNDDMVKSLMELISEYGQMENAIAYKDEKDFYGNVDGKKYTLLGGNTRYLAISKLLESGQGDGYINISVVDKPQSHKKELEKLVLSNVQRNKTPEERYKEIRVMSTIYDEADEKPTGTKRDWIGSKLGISGRYVDKLIKKFNPSNDSDDAESDEENEVLENQTNIYEYIDDEDGNNSILNEENDHEITLNANAALTNDDIKKMLNNNIKNIKATVHAGEEIGMDSLVSELKSILNEIQSLVEML